MAPHVDDEVIGCFSLLEKGLITDVVYMFELTDERRAEALACAKKYNFNPIFASDFGDWDSRDIESGDNIFVPTIKDSHPDHKYVNNSGRWLSKNKNCNIFFYSVDMNTRERKTLTFDQRAAKRLALNELFPSQSNLLSDDKYSFFEHIAESEVDVISTLWDSTGNRGVSITASCKVELTQEDLSKIESIDDAILKYWNNRVSEIWFSNNGEGSRFSG